MQKIKFILDKYIKELYIDNRCLVSSSGDEKNGA